MTTAPLPQAHESPEPNAPNGKPNGEPTHEPNALTADLLDEVARQRRAAPRPVPRLLRSAELMALAPPLRAQVLAHARRAAATDPPTLLAMLLYLAATLVLLYAAAPAHIGLWLLLAWLPPALRYQLGVRRAARRLASELVRQR